MSKARKAFLFYEDGIVIFNSIIVKVNLSDAKVLHYVTVKKSKTNNLRKDISVLVAVAWCSPVCYRRLVAPAVRVLKQRKKKVREKMYPLPLQAVLVLLGTCGPGLGQPVLHTGTLREAGL